ncbi:MAG: hypothetical protein JWQ11_1753, partial [Rhizobacter sp.]|nr:hypothetical protein [Rhizobacter sp.]
MSARKWLGLVAVTAALMVGLVHQAQAATAPAQVDVKGGHDHPLIQRFSGSWLVGYKANDWEQAQFPTSMNVKDDQ